MTKMLKYLLPIVLLFVSLPCRSGKSDVLIGAFYFDGWAGENKKTKVVENPPTHLTSELATTYSGRKPVWGWRDDDVSIMERQIDLAAENGIDFFVFCWYWAKDKGSFDQQYCESKPTNTSIRLFMKARNRHKMKFAILIANHKGAEIIGQDNWTQAISYLSETYFHDSQYLKVDGKPYLCVFSPKACVPYVSAMKERTDGLYMVSCYSEQKGFDMMTWYNIRLPEHGCSEQRTYKELIDYAESKWNGVPYTTNFSPLVMAGWDNRPWETEEKKGVYCVDRSPKLFKRHLKNAIQTVNNRPSVTNKTILIYAWNELGEGGYIIPTAEDPKGKYLKMVKKVKNSQ